MKYLSRFSHSHEIIIKRQFVRVIKILFSLPSQYIVKQTGDENKEHHQLDCSCNLYLATTKSYQTLPGKLTYTEQLDKNN